MGLHVETGVDGRTLSDFLGVTRDELADSMDAKMLLAAAKDKRRQFAGWMEQTHWTGLSDQVAEHVCGFLGENLAGIFAGAWAKYSEMTKAAKETLDDPARTVDIGLADHEFEYELEPSVDILLNGKSVAKIEFKITAKFAVSALELSLKKGCAYRVRCGKCDCKAEIACAGTTVWERNLLEVELPGELNLKKPVALAH